MFSKDLRMGLNQQIGEDCACNVVEELAQDSSSSIIFDEEMSEFRIRSQD